MSAPAPIRSILFATLFSFLLATASPAQMTSDQQAAMLLAGARRAYNEKNFPFAADRFREFLAKFGGHRDALSARYGLAMSLIDGPTKDYDKALEQLNQLTGQKTFIDYPFVLYYTGLARRGVGTKSIELALAKPTEAVQHRNTARQRFDEASKSFDEAAKVFADKAKGVKNPDKGLSVEREWAVRSRCDQAEMLLRISKAKEAREAVAPLLTDKDLAASRYLSLAAYYHGFASFLLQDNFSAGKSLSRDKVLGDEVFGTHARYLLARVYHLNTKQNEREEARQAYQAVLRDHEANRKKAEEKLRQPDQFRNDPETKARLERLVRGPAPDHLARSTFFLAVLQYEDGRFAEALEHFKSFLTAFPTAVLSPEARLRVGFCQVQLKQNDDAIKSLQPLADKEPALADQAIYWIARAEKNKADPAKPDTFKPALESFRKAAEKAQQRIAADPRARERRGQILADMAEVQQQILLYRDAINTYTLILNEKLLPQREDEMILSQATAYQLAGDYNEADKACQRFLDMHKSSTLLPALLFRQAENSALRALAAEKMPNPADRLRETTKFNDEAMKRYETILEKYPEYTHVHLARLGLGMAQHRKGQLDKAQKTLEGIPASERSGELAIVSYNLADLYLRQAPATADDAVTAGRLEEKVKGAAELLDIFLSSAPESKQAPDALLKLGYCRQRLAKLLVQPAEQQKALSEARAAYEKIQQKYAKDPAFAQATFERAKVLAMQKDIGNAMNELRRFAADPLKKESIAPMALLHLATLQRGQNKPADAATTLADCRKEHEEALKREPARAAWVILLQYHHAAALREAGKLADARVLFDTVGKSALDRAEGYDALLRAGQCDKQSGDKKIADGKKMFASAGQKADQRAAADKLITEGTQDLRNAVTYLSAQEAGLRTRKPASEELQKSLATVRARMLYESAWGWRSLVELEIEAAQLKLQLLRWQTRREEVARLTPPGQTPPTVGLPEVRLAEVPEQPAEAQVRLRYTELIKAFPELAINADARFELAELLAVRNKHDDAIKLLQEALEGEKEPSAELAERIKVRLSACLLDRGTHRMLEGNRVLTGVNLTAAVKAAAEKLITDGKKDLEAALEQVQTVTANDKSLHLAQASYREAECQLQLGKTDEAIKLLSKFRDHGPFQNLPGLTDRALLRLGFALAEKKQWEPSRQAYETCVNRFGTSPWIHEARYGVAWAYQNLAQYDTAVNNFNLVVGGTATQIAAKAQLNIGICRLLQKRYPDATTALLVVPYTYDYPDLSALALVEAARGMTENKQTEQAVKLLRRVIRDHVGTAHAEAARKRLTALGES